MKVKNTDMTPEQKKLKTKQELIRVLKFVAFSCSAGLIQIGSFTLLNEVVKMSYWPAYLISLTLSVLWNFTFNRKFTFKSANNVPIAMLKVFGYYCVFTPLSTLWGDALTGIGWNEYIVLAGTMIINMTTEFLFCQFVVYRKSMNTNAAGKKEEEKLNELSGTPADADKNSTESITDITTDSENIYGEATGSVRVDEVGTKEPSDGEPK